MPSTQQRSYAFGCLPDAGGGEVKVLNRLPAADHQGQVGRGILAVFHEAANVDGCCDNPGSERWDRLLENSVAGCVSLLVTIAEIRCDLAQRSWWELGAV